jgi:hypothetical protein
MTVSELSQPPGRKPAFPASPAGRLGARTTRAAS